MGWGKKLRKRWKKGIGKALKASAKLALAPVDESLRIAFGRKTSVLGGKTGTQSFIRGAERAVGGGGLQTKAERKARAAQQAAMTEQERLDAELKAKELSAATEAANLQSALIYSLRRVQPRGGSILTPPGGLQQAPHLAYRSILGV